MHVSIADQCPTVPLVSPEAPDAVAGPLVCNKASAVSPGKAAGGFCSRSEFVTVSRVDHKSGQGDPQPARPGPAVPVRPWVTAGGDRGGPWLWRGACPHTSPRAHSKQIHVGQWSAVKVSQSLLSCPDAPRPLLTPSDLSDAPQHPLMSCDPAGHSRGLWAGEKDRACPSLWLPPMLGDMGAYGQCVPVAMPQAAGCGVALEAGWGAEPCGPAWPRRTCVPSAPGVPAWDLNAGGPQPPAESLPL